MIVHMCIIIHFHPKCNTKQKKLRKESGTGEKRADCRAAAAIIKKAALNGHVHVSFGWQKGVVAQRCKTGGMRSFTGAYRLFGGLFSYWK